MNLIKLTLISIAGWMNRQQQDVIEYLQEEIKVLKEQQGGKRLRFTDDQRARLTRKAKRIRFGRLACLIHGGVAQRDFGRLASDIGASVGGSPSRRVKSAKIAQRGHTGGHPPSIFSARGCADWLTHCGAGDPQRCQMRRCVGSNASERCSRTLVLSTSIRPATLNRRSRISAKVLRSHFVPANTVLRKRCRIA